MVKPIFLKVKKELHSGKIRAYGLAYDVKVKIDDSDNKSDAILIDIYHQKSNDIPKYYFPYSWNKNDDLVFGDSFGIKK